MSYYAEKDKAPMKPYLQKNVGSPRKDESEDTSGKAPLSYTVEDLRNICLACVEL